MHTKFKLLASIAASLFAAGQANAAEIFFTNESGNIGVYDTDTATFGSVTDLSSSYSIGQVIGLAYDGSTNTIFALDRTLRQVYAVNAGTGASAVAFSPAVEFQGGAFKGGTLFGIDEGSQTLDGYTVATGTDLGIGGSNIDHTHGLGIDAATGQLYSARAGSIFKMADDGTDGSLVASIAGSPFVEDLDWYGGDFLYVDYGSSVNLASTGGALFTASIGSLTGVAWKQSAGTPAVPEPASWAMMIGGFAIAGAAMRRRNVRIAFA